MGAAHTGVSTTLRREAGELQGARRVALLASATRWAPHRRTLADWLTDAVIQQRPEQAHPAHDDRMLAEHTVEDPGTVALIDDLEALPVDAHGAAWVQIAEYAKTHTVFVGCRESAFDRMPTTGSPTVLRLKRPRLSEVESADGSAYTHPDAMPVLATARRASEPALDTQTFLVTTYLIGALADAGPGRASLVRRLRFLARHLDRQKSDEFRFWRLIAEVPWAVTATVFGAVAAAAFELTFWASYLLGEALTPGVMSDMVGAINHYLDMRGLSFLNLTDPAWMPGHLWWVGIFTALGASLGFAAPEGKTELPSAGRARTRLDWAGGARGVRRAFLFAPLFIAVTSAMLVADWPSALWQSEREWLAGLGYHPDSLWEMLLVNLSGYPAIVTLMGVNGLLSTLAAPTISLRRNDFRATLAQTRRRAGAAAIGATAGSLLFFLAVFPVIDLGSDEFMTTRPGFGTLIVMGTLTGLCLAPLVLLNSTWGEFALARAYLAATGRLPYRLTDFLDYMRERGVLSGSGSALTFRNPIVRQYLTQVSPARGARARGPAPGRS